MNEDLRTSAGLETDETILWTGQPDPAAAGKLSRAQSNMAFGCLLLLAGVFGVALVLTLLFGWELNTGNMVNGLLICGGLALVFKLFIPRIQRQASRHATTVRYLLTDRRAISYSVSKRTGKVDKSLIPPKRMIPFTVRKGVGSKGLRDVLFAKTRKYRRNRGRFWAKDGFLYLPPHEAEELADILRDKFGLREDPDYEIPKGR